MGRRCAVPNCYTGYRDRKTDEKISLYKVPDNDYLLSKWNEAIAREDRPVTPKDYVCDKHFTPDDIAKTRLVKDVVMVYQRPRLKEDAIPSIFPDLPEFITQMTRKRRKIDLTQLQKMKKTESFENKTIIKHEPTEYDAVSDESFKNLQLKNEIFIKDEVVSDDDK